MATPSGYNYYCDLTLAGIPSGTVTDYPLALTLPAAAATHSLSSGLDIRFAIGSTELSFQRIDWPSRLFRVRVPSWSTSSVTVRAYWGKSSDSDASSTGVWDSGFAAAYGLDEASGSGTRYDSTANGNNSSSVVGTPQSCAGKVFTGTQCWKDGYGVQASPTKDAIVFPWTLGTANTFSWDGWFYTDVYSTQYPPVVEQRSAAGAGWIIFLYASTGRVSFLSSTGGSLDSTLSAGWAQWSHIGLTVTSGVVRLYVNGVKHSSTASGFVGVNNASWQIGRNKDAYFYPTRHDDIRVSNVARSDEYMALAYNAVVNYGSVVSWGAEQAAQATISVTPQPASTIFNATASAPIKITSAATSAILLRGQQLTVTKSGLIVPTSAAVHGVTGGATKASAPAPSHSTLNATSVGASKVSTIEPSHAVTYTVTLGALKVTAPESGRLRLNALVLSATSIATAYPEPAVAPLHATTLTPIKRQAPATTGATLGALSLASVKRAGFQVAHLSLHSVVFVGPVMHHWRVSQVEAFVIGANRGGAFTQGYVLAESFVPGALKAQRVNAAQ